MSQKRKFIERFLNNGYDFLAKTASAVFGSNRDLGEKMSKTVLYDSVFQIRHASKEDAELIVEYMRKLGIY